MVHGLVFLYPVYEPAEEEKSLYNAPRWFSCWQIASPCHYLKTAYGMTPDQYRERWGLPSNYPMVAPSYAKRRSGIAKGIGLGTHRKKSAA